MLLNSFITECFHKLLVLKEHTLKEYLNKLIENLFKRCILPPLF